MTHILRIDEMASTRQLGVREYMNANHPNINAFNDGLTPFKYNGYLFYPVASRPATNNFNKIDRKIEYSDWCNNFSKNISYDWTDFYNTAKIYGYGNCDVFACKIGGKIHYFIPTTRMFCEYPMKYLFKGNTEDLDNMVNDMLYTVANNRVDELVNTQQNNVFDAVKNELTIGMPYTDAENILRKHGLCLSEYGNVHYNRQDKGYAEYNLTGERGECPNIVLYYEFVRVPNERDSWVAGDTYDIVFCAEDGSQGSIDGKFRE